MRFKAIFKKFNLSLFYIMYLFGYTVIAIDLNFEKNFWNIRMKNSARGRVDPFIVMDVMEAARQIEKLGHEVQIVNTQSPVDILKQINSFRPQFVHIQYDDFIEVYPYIQYPCAITSHFGYLEQPNRWDYYGDRIAKPFGRIKPNVFCLSAGIKDTYMKQLDIPEERLL